MENFEMKRIAVTGATSMLGAALIEKCARQNVEVLAFARRASKKLGRLPRSPLVKIVECDLAEMAAFNGGGERCDVFYHFAWESTDKTARDNPMPQLENLRRAFDAVVLAERLGCKKFIGAGSQAEYGMTSEIISPTTRVDPNTSYGVAKFAAGKLCAKLCEQKNMVCVWPRIFSVYGEYESPSSLVSYLLGCFLRGEVAKVSAATQNWEYLYQSDAADFLFALGERRGASGIYTLSSTDTRPLKSYIEEIQKITDGKLQVEFAPPSPAQAVSLQSDIGDLLRDTGIMPKVEFAEGVKTMIEFLQKSVLQ